MKRLITHFRLVSLSIFLTVVLAACGGEKRVHRFHLRYDADGLITSSLISDNTPLATGERYQPGQKLLSTSWGQDAPYNSLLPRRAEEAMPVGCVNTALGQVMSYYADSISTKGKRKGTLNQQIAWADFDQAINWKLLSSPSKVSDLEIGTLFRNLVIANQTTLRTSANGGSSTSVASALKSMVLHLGFSNSITSETKLAEEINTELERRLMMEINHKRPILLSTSGTLNHLLVIDGYKIENNEVLFHLNLGWEGLYDGFYSLNKAFEIHQQFTRDEQVYTTTLSADEYTFYYNIQPCTDQCFSNREISDTSTDHLISGKFHHPLDEDIYGPFSASQSIQILKDNLNRAPYYISILDRGLQPVIENINNFDFSSEDAFYVRLSPKSIFTTSYYPATTAYQLSILKQPQDSNSIVDDTIFTFRLSHTAVNLSNESIIRIQSAPYLPEGISFQIDDQGNDTGAVLIENNLIKIDRSKFAKDYIGSLKVNALRDGKIISSQDLNLANLASGLQLEKEQKMTGELTPNGTHSFKTVLKGHCAISGDRGFSNQGFYLSTDLHSPTDNTIQSFFEPGIYEIKASLSNGLSSYTYAPDKTEFIVRISCDDEVRDLAELKSLL
ncbi:MAG: hypothetical protein CME71_01105 [Halobacteriovorax sp.]|nr:hypothetical protein [Halobacteriovorax sp.]|tara:strand:- start:2223 stop:4067 length:1845 start_codon:yes stop_codon:yes gene_type:complete